MSGVFVSSSQEPRGPRCCWWMSVVTTAGDTRGGAIQPASTVTFLSHSPSELESSTANRTVSVAPDRVVLSWYVSSSTVAQLGSETGSQLRTVLYLAVVEFTDLFHAFSGHVGRHALVTSATCLAQALKEQRNQAGHHDE